MSRIWITADHHFGHANIIRFCDRPFADAAEMDAALIARWNEMVAPEDTVYHLGDFVYRSGRDAGAYLERLNGKVILVAGNHDTPSARSAFAESHDILNVRVGGRMLVMCHYAMRVWPGSCRGSLHCYAHSHGKLPAYGRSMDVGVDTNGFYPYDIDDVAARLIAVDPRADG